MASDEIHRRDGSRAEPSSAADVAWWSVTDDEVQTGELRVGVCRERTRLPGPGNDVG